MAVVLPIEVKIADLDEVKAVIERAGEEIAALRHLLREWEPRVRCLQCGERYSHRACGPTHAVISAQVGRLGGMDEAERRARPTRSG